MRFLSSLFGVILLLAACGGSNSTESDASHDEVVVLMATASLTPAEVFAAVAPSVVFVEVPDAGKSIEKEGQAAVVESTKAASDVYSPISGEVTEGNKAIADDPGSVNGDPEGASWFFKLKIKDKGELDTLMSKEEYDKFCKENPN